MKPKDYLDFKLVGHKPKTKVYHVISNEYKSVLGVIKWHAPWRQYCFFPSEGTVWSRSCLNQINEFIDKLMKEKRQ